MSGKLNKKKTGNAIIKHCQKTPGMSIKVDEFWKKFVTIADFKEGCKFCGIQPILD